MGGFVMVAQTIKTLVGEWRSRKQLLASRHPAISECCRICLGIVWNEALIALPRAQLPGYCMDQEVWTGALIALSR